MTSFLYRVYPKNWRAGDLVVGRIPIVKETAKQIIVQRSQATGFGKVIYLPLRGYFRSAEEAVEDFRSKARAHAEAANAALAVALEPIPEEQVS